MADLGSFGAALRELDDNPTPDTFEFCGETFTVRGRIPPLLTVKLGAATSGNLREDALLGATWEILRLALTAPAKGDMPADESEFDRFCKVATENYTEFEDIVRVTVTLASAVTGRPTERDSDSLPGVLPISPSSSPSSTHPALLHLTPVSSLQVG